MARYAEYYDYITGTGVIVPDTSAVLSDIQAEWKDVFGENLSVEPETPQGRIIEMIARQRIFTVQMAAALSNILNINKAYGFVLDDLGSLFQLSRKSATSSVVQIQMNGVVNTVIPVGTELLSDNGDKFVNDYEYIIGSNGSVTGAFHSQETGEIAAQANTITTIVSQVSGLETVTNPEPAELGSEQESDQEFRNRIKGSLNINSTSVLSAIKSAVANVEGVKQVVAYENTANTAFVLNTIFSIPAHGFGIIVDYTETDPGTQPVANAIAEAIYKKKTLGAGQISAQTTAGEAYIVTIDYPDENDGQGHNITFAKPIPVTVETEITVSKKNYAGDDLEGDIKTAIANFMNGDNPEVDRVDIGGTLSPFEIAAAISSEIPDIFVSTITIAKTGDAQSTNPIALGEAEKLVINSEDITVTIND